MEHSLEVLLRRAKDLEKEGKVRMASLAFNSFLERASLEELNQDELKQVHSLIHLRNSYEQVNAVDENGLVEDSTFHVCTRCNGTGKFESSYKCYSCKGKGTRREEDISREKAYYARKQKQVQTSGEYF